jgi:hypothetical protein
MSGENTLKDGNCSKLDLDSPEKMEDGNTPDGSPNSGIRNNSTYVQL